MKIVNGYRKFTEIESARSAFCSEHDNCLSCKLYAVCDGDCRNCKPWCANNIREAAKIMGYTVIDEQEDKMLDISNMTLKQAKEYCESRCKEMKLCEENCDFFEREICDKEPTLWRLDRKIIKKKPRISAQELDICRALGAKWLSRNSPLDEDEVKLWREKPEKIDGLNGLIGYAPSDNGESLIGHISVAIFPSVNLGDCICVSEE